jgi:hypothetical protein
MQVAKSVYIVLIYRVPASTVARHWPAGLGQAKLISLSALQAG